MTVTENIRFGIKGVSRRAMEGRVDNLLEQTGIRDLKDRFPNEISGGQARRAALARALAPNNPYLLMDEPLTNVEPALKDRLLCLIKEEVQRTGSTLLYVTHDLDEARKIAGIIYTLNHGSLKAWREEEM